MKKLAIMAALVAAVSVATAADVGVRYSTTSNTVSETTGVTVGQKFGKIGAEFAFDRAVSGNNNDRYSLIGSYDVATIAGATVAVKAGGAYVQPTIGETGYAAVAGVGVSYPLTKSVSAVADYSYQRGQERIQSFDGNTLSVGVKYSF